MSERDTKFREGFAQLLVEDIEPDLFDIAMHIDPDGAKQRIKDKFSQRAYDLACHVVEYSGGADMADWPDSEIVSNLPDLTQWPD